MRQARHRIDEPRRITDVDTQAVNRFSSSYEKGMERINGPPQPDGFIESYAAHPNAYLVETVRDDNVIASQIGLQHDDAIYASLIGMPEGLLQYRQMQGILDTFCRRRRSSALPSAFAWALTTLARVSMRRNWGRRCTLFVRSATNLDG